MRSLWAVLRWSLVLAPVLGTGAWLRVSAAEPRTASPVLSVPHLRVAPARAAPVVHASAAREPDRIEPPPKRAPKPAPDPCEHAEGAAEAPAREVFFGETEAKRVAITFDDGPSRQNTPRVLRTLRRAEVEATFFVLGDRAERMPDLLRAIAADGHEIGNHGYSHASMRSLWKSQIRDEVCRTHRAVKSATGQAPTLVRPPYGRYAPSAVPLLGGLGYDLVLWSVDAHDWRGEDAARMASRVVRAAQPGSIILMHDRESLTAEALPLVVDGLRRRGFEIVPVSTLLGRATD